MEQKISIEQLKNQAYESARVDFVWSLRIKVAFVVINVLILTERITLASKVNQAVATLFILLLVTFFDFFMSRRYRTKYDMAETLRKVQFNYFNYNLEPSPIEKGYLLVDKATPATSEAKIDYNENYFENQNLKFSTLQNIFFTARNYAVHAGFFGILFLVCAGGIFLAVTAAFFYPSISFLPKTVLFLITVFFAYNFVDIIFSFWIKSKQLKKLDFRLSLTSADEPNQIASLLVDYNTILTNAYPTFNFLYKKHQRTTNSAWQVRLLAAGENDYNYESYLSELKLLFQSNGNYNEVDLLLIGSAVDGTFIFGKSDLDILLVVENQIDGVDPQQFYQDIYQILRTKYKSAVRKSRPSFIIRDFGDVVVELTPSLKSNGNLNVVDESTGWREISPNEHIRYFNEIDSNWSGFFKKVFTIIKTWKYDNNIQVSSFYLQVVLGQVFEDFKTGRKYPNEVILCAFFRKLKSCRFKPIQDPIRKLGMIKPKHIGDVPTYSKEIDKAIINNNYIMSEDLTLINRIIQYRIDFAYSMQLFFFASKRKNKERKTKEKYRRTLSVLSIVSSIITLSGLVFYFANQDHETGAIHIHCIIPIVNYP